MPVYRLPTGVMVTALSLVDAISNPHVGFWAADKAVPTMLATMTT